MAGKPAQIEVHAAAKINLMLDIIWRRTDGYHDLFMVMQSVGIYDRVTVAPAKRPGITLTCSETSLPTDEKNIAYRAAQAFFECVPIREKKDVAIHIDKKIPFAAGLAGGSADGAAVLVALNALYKTGLTVAELCKIGVSIGADVPFCIRGGTMLAQGIGDVLHPLPPLPACFFVLAKPEQGVNTAKAYGEYDRVGRQYEPQKLKMLTAMQEQNLDKICSCMANVFEQFIEVADRVMLRQVMTAHGAKGVCMSGSGPTVFGIFTEKAQADACALELSRSIREVSVCAPVQDGCKIILP